MTFSSTKDIFRYPMSVKEVTNQIDAEKSERAESCSNAG
tara:strand:- start:1229 stop:1345 length:117 start_codon:yes stop_codon:yes gene_type:complete